MNDSSKMLAVQSNWLDGNYIPATCSSSFLNIPVMSATLQGPERCLLWQISKKLPTVVLPKPGVSLSQGLIVGTRSWLPSLHSAHYRKEFHKNICLFFNDGSRLIFILVLINVQMGNFRTEFCFRVYILKKCLWIWRLFFLSHTLVSLRVKCLSWLQHRQYSV